MEQQQTCLTTESDLPALGILRPSLSVTLPLGLSCSSKIIGPNIRDRVGRDSNQEIYVLYRSEHTRFHAGCRLGWKDNGLC